MKIRQISIAYFCAFLLIISSFATNASVINFTGQLDFIEEDNGAGIYTGISIGTEFSGDIDDNTASGSISDGLTVTSFSCCIAAGALSLTNDKVLDSDDVDFANTLLGFSKYNAGDVVDIVDIEGDVATTGGGRIEIGISYLLDSNSFANTSLSNYPFDPGNIELALFFILEEDANGQDIYSAGGQITSVPLPASIGFFSFAVLGLWRKFRAKNDRTII